jgi:hypothetical protein
MKGLLSLSAILGFTLLVMVAIRPAAPAPIATPAPVQSVYLPMLIGQTNDITVTLAYYSDEQYGSYHQVNYMFILEASSIISHTEGDFLLAIKNDFQKKKSSFIFSTGGKLTKLPQMSQMVKLQETANNLIKQYAKFNLE